jgi:hypothetical protein
VYSQTDTLQKGEMMNLLQAINDIIDNDYDHIAGVESASTLIKPLQMQLLQKRYKGLEKEFDRSKARIGTLIHKGLETFLIDNDNLIQEKRLYTTINGVKISGKFDAFDVERKVVIDFKSTSTYTYKHKKYDSYIEQLNIYNMLLDDNGYQVSNKGEVLLLMTDWKESKVDAEENYPESAIMTVSLDLETPANTKAYLERKLFLQAKFDGLNDSELPECTESELWKDPDEWTVDWFTKKGDKAKYPKRFTIEKEAIDYAVSVNTNSNSHLVYPIKIEGIAKRCNYCSISEFCNQYKQMMEK